MVEHPTVRMVSEKVHAKIGWKGAKVRCEFVFKNDGPATVVSMGFPEKSWGDVGPIVRSGMGGFKSWVDGEPFATKFVPSRKSLDGGPREYKAWHVKDVPFGAHQTRTVVNEYDSGLGMDSMGGRFFNYILRSGKSWKGKIREALIEVDVSEIPPCWKVSGGPPGSRVRGESKITWTLRDFEPDADVTLYIQRKEKVWIGGPRYGDPVTAQQPRSVDDCRCQMAHVRRLDGSRDWGVLVSWDAAKRECTVEYRGRSLRLIPDSQTAFLDDASEVELPCAPYVARRGRFIAPIVAVAEALGMTVTRDSERGFISILEAGIKQ